MVCVRTSRWFCPDGQSFGFAGAFTAQALHQSAVMLDRAFSSVLFFGVRLLRRARVYLRSRPQRI